MRLEAIIAAVPGKFALRTQFVIPRRRHHVRDLVAATFLLGAKRGTATLEKAELVKCGEARVKRTPRFGVATFVFEPPASQEFARFAQVCGRFTFCALVAAHKSERVGLQFAPNS
jgi:hypothetical protein